MNIMLAILLLFKVAIIKWCRTIFPLADVKARCTERLNSGSKWHRWDLNPGLSDISIECCPLCLLLPLPSEGPIFSSLNMPGFSLLCPITEKPRVSTWSNEGLLCLQQLAQASFSPWKTSNPLHIGSGNFIWVSKYPELFSILNFVELYSHPFLISMLCDAWGWHPGLIYFLPQESVNEWMNLSCALRKPLNPGPRHSSEASCRERRCMVSGPVNGHQLMWASLAWPVQEERKPLLCKDWEEGLDDSS